MPLIQRVEVDGFVVYVYAYPTPESCTVKSTRGSHNLIASFGQKPASERWVSVD